MRKMIKSLVAMILLGFASVCLFEVSRSIATDALAALLFVLAACCSIPFEESINSLRHGN